MAKTGFSTKYEVISKDQRRTVVAVAIASIILGLCLVYSNSLLGKMSHQNRVIAAQESALKVLRDSKNSLQILEQSFEEFIASAQPATHEGKTNLDTVRDALPSVYNYPNLLVNMENLFRTASYTVRVSAANQQEQVTKTSPNPVPEELPLSLTFTASEDDFLDIFNRLHLSIRPIHIRQVTISKTANDTKDLTVNLSAVTYFLPKKYLEIDTEVIQ